MEILLCNKLDDAIVAYIVKKWNEVSEVPLGRTIIQKLCYFAKSKGIPLDYDFDMYHYGPYSQNLYYRMDDMTADSVVNDDNVACKNTNIKSCKSKYMPGNNIDKLINIYKDDIDKFTADIDSVINVFHDFDHTGLELLSTIHFFQTTLSHFYNKPANKNDVIAKVKNAKGDKFKDDLISKAYDALKKAGIFEWHEKN
ncbi:hypothetical protein [Pseudobacteroides cellulosolvens]|uniref:Antitoxin SocA-like Panacea domain-containing protein n=1 Tax=Pseudobacteroides cellulosolvens ATCC 35603 = DSM 2933 TaxID=398512 RepID=A0A0L6JWJ4_9FIRM|nr:hypothetical protein [Pseudobacteroides cellulosolvens]KNY30211.1 hypothetical protein Bccel_5488 [Pseudobacteroides cellulosolvens ATCC 35603 = DSM 2933]